jgi:hypothetical protein
VGPIAPTCCDHRICALVQVWWNARDCSLQPSMHSHAIRRDKTKRPPLPFCFLFSAVCIRSYVEVRAN